QAAPPGAHTRPLHDALPIFGPGLSDGDDNLVMRAVHALLKRARGPQRPVVLTLDKQLPVAAGLGGGSSDAGAALRLLREAMEIRSEEHTSELQSRENLVCRL